MRLILDITIVCVCFLSFCHGAYGRRERRRGPEAGDREEARGAGRQVPGASEAVRQGGRCPRQEVYREAAAILGQAHRSPLQRFRRLYWHTCLQGLLSTGYEESRDWADHRRAR